MITGKNSKKHSEKKYISPSEKPIGVLEWLLSLFVIAIFVSGFAFSVFFLRTYDISADSRFAREKTDSTETEFTEIAEESEVIAETEYVDSSETEAGEEVSTEEVGTEEAVTEIVTETEEPVEEHIIEEYDLAPLKEQLQAAIDSYSGDWSVYVSQLNYEDNAILINDEGMLSASVIKIFIMGTAYEAIYEGDFTEEELKSNLQLMITISSNIAANQLLCTLGNGDCLTGIERVNAFITEHGYNVGTHQANGFNDSRYLFGGYNIATAADCGHFLEDLYHLRVINEEYSQKMLDLLDAQRSIYKIPANLPADKVTVMNKTGETEEIENDVAIIFSPYADYVICVFSSDWDSKEEAVLHIRDLSTMTYEYFNGEIPEGTTTIRDVDLAKQAAEKEKQENGN